jgi:methylated-DNA-[protein]-cysteine S-methyltransferase
VIREESWFAVARIETIVGLFSAVFTERGLACLTLPTESEEQHRAWAARHLTDEHRVEIGTLHCQFEAELHAYLAGSLQAFSIPLDLRGTPFQHQVWQAVRDIAYGAISTYAQIAQAIGRPLAVRAVGAANGANPIPILVPCHRLVGADGSLRGYGGGLAFKQMLLQLEGHPAGVSTPGAS